MISFAIPPLHYSTSTCYKTLPLPPPLLPFSTLFPPFILHTTPTSLPFHFPPLLPHPFPFTFTTLLPPSLPLHFHHTTPTIPSPSLSPTISSPLHSPHYSHHPFPFTSPTHSHHPFPFTFTTLPTIPSPSLSPHYPPSLPLHFHHTSLPLHFHHTTPTIPSPSLSPHIPSPSLSSHYFHHPFPFTFTTLLPPSLPLHFRHNSHNTAHSDGPTALPAPVPRDQRDVIERYVSYSIPAKLYSHTCRHNNSDEPGNPVGLQMRAASVQPCVVSHQLDSCHVTLAGMAI